MYLSEDKKAALRKCFENQRSAEKEGRQRGAGGLHETEDARKVSQILFDARDGKEVFTPF